MGLAPTRKRRLFTAHAVSGHFLDLDRLGSLDPAGPMPTACSERLIQDVNIVRSARRLGVDHKKTAYKNRPLDEAEGVGPEIGAASVRTRSKNFDRVSHVGQPTEQKGMKLP